MPEPVSGPFRTKLRDAICHLILDPAVGLVPVTSVAAPTSIGATAFQAASSGAAALFRKDGVATVWDDSGEFPVVVDHVTGDVVTFKFDGRYDAAGNPITGLTASHLAGAVIATNLLQVPPNPRDATLTRTMTGNGFPVIRVFAPDLVETWGTNTMTQPIAMCSIVYELPLEQNDATKLPSDLWLLQQADRADRELELLKDAVKANWGLIVGDEYHAEYVDRFIQAGRRNTAASQVPLYQDYLDIHVFGPDRPTQ